MRIGPRLRRPLVKDAVLLAGLVAVVGFLWGRAAGSMWYWTDEGISVGIASHPFGDIPTLLRQDGSPPLYYLLLHVWMKLFGTSEASTHTLSLLFSMATVPAALWGGWSLYGRRAGWMCALLAALNPFLATYSSETRMYSMVVLLGLLATGSFVHAFVFGRRRYLAAFAVFLTLLLYTHNWGLLFGVGAVLALVPCVLFNSDRKRLMVDATLSFGFVALAYAPWLPTLLYQRGQELQPWAFPVTLQAARAEIVGLFGGGDILGTAAAVVLGAGVASGLVVMLRMPLSRSAVGIIAAAVLVAVVISGGWITSVWVYRYLAAVVGPLILVAGAGLAGGGRTALAALWVVALATAPIATKGASHHKSNSGALGDQAGRQLRAGDLVISTDPHVVPLLAHYLPSGVRYVTTSGPVADEGIVDWRKMTDRLRDGQPATTLPPLMESLPRSAHVLLTCPPVPAVRQSARLGGTAGAAPTASPAPATSPSGAPAPAAAAPSVVTQTVPAPSSTNEFHALTRQRCLETAGMLLSDPRFQLQMTLEAPADSLITPVDGYLFTKR
ncbi:MAG: glycosyltransferase family 39 protein [Actinomycetota bacterium]|nr:glycosyltransferase family 39 protein [Actinomycetota bacterium]